MPENEQILNEETEEFDAVEEIKKLKESMVSKEDYDKVKKENAKLMKTLIKGGHIDNPVEKKSIDDLRKELFLNSATATNLEYVTKMLDLRDAVIESGRADPFAGGSDDATSYVEAENVANILKKCVEDSEGDPDQFNSILGRTIKDSRR